MALSCITSSRGKKLMVHNNYMYYLKKTYKDKCYWWCLNRLCRGKLTVINETETKVTEFHCHEPDIRDLQERNFRAILKERVKDDAELPIPKIYEEELEKIAAISKEVASTLPPLEAIKSSLYRLRNELRKPSSVDGENEQIGATNDELLNQQTNQRMKNPKVKNEGTLLMTNKSQEKQISEPVLEFVNFDALEDNSSNHDSPPTPVEINAPEIKLEVIEQDDNSESNAQTEKVELCKNENKKKTAFKRKRTSDVSLLREALDGTSSNSSRNEDEDDCDLYGKLIAKKLRKLTESQRERLMYEIQGLFVKISQYRLPL